MSKKSKNLKKELIYILGLVFLAIGLLGVILPVIRGLLFILIGLFLLGIINKRTLKKFKKKYFDKHLKKMRK